MIGRVRGIVVERGPSGIVVETGGIGYEIALTPRGLSELPPLGEEAVVHTHLHVREDQQALYGFLSAEERDIFRVLLGASGVGPKLAERLYEARPYYSEDELEYHAHLPQSVIKLIIDRIYYG